MSKVYEPFMVGIDHGYKNMKTKTQVFESRISEIMTKPDSLDGILEYQGKYYSIYGAKVSSASNHNKADSEEFYLLTLAAFGKELSERGISKGDVYLSAGLPQRWYFAQKDAFKESLQKEKHLIFTFEGKEFDLNIANVNMYIQGYAAALSVLMKKYPKQKAIIVDIGGETVDIIAVNAGKILYDECKISTKASIYCMKNAVEHINTELFEDVDEDYVLEYIQSGSKDKTPVNEYETVLQKSLMEYSDMIFELLKDYKINTKVTPVVFVGGGAGIIRKFGTYQAELTDFVTDLCGNARGYEMLDKVILGKKG